MLWAAWIVLDVLQTVYVAVILAVAGLITIGVVSSNRFHRRLHRRAATTPCAACGAILGEAALAAADALWSERMAALMRDTTGMRLRVVRDLWAICQACGAYHDLDRDTETLVLCSTARASRWRNPPTPDDDPPPSRPPDGRSA